MRQETVGKHVLHADSIYLVWRTKVIHIRLKTTGAKTTFTNGSDAGPLHQNGYQNAQNFILIPNLKTKLRKSVQINIYREKTSKIAVFCE